jgi:hypothetical protein
MGGTFHLAGCCCPTEEFCLGCEQAEPDAVVTIEGEGVGNCEEWCDVYEGTYEYLSTSHDTSGNEYYCWWTLRHDTVSSMNINLLYCHSSEKWYARLNQVGTIYGGDVDDPCEGIMADNWKEVEIECQDGGELSGNFVLDGIGSCEDCEAAVTLG